MKRLLISLVILASVIGISAHVGATRVCGTLQDVNFGMQINGNFEAGNTQYAVVAVNPFGQASNAHTVGINVQVSAQGPDDFLRVLWQPVPGARNYLVYRVWQSNNQNNLGLIAKTPNLSFDDTNPLAHGSKLEVCGPKIGG